MPLIEDPKQIKLNRDDDVQTLLGDPPGWFLRWGITVVGFTTIMLLILSWVVRYPDIVRAPVRLLTEQPAIRIHAQRSGKLDQLLVQDQQRVSVGDLVAVLENPADLSAMQALKQFVTQSVENLETGSIEDLELPQAGQLGPLESAFAEFKQQWQDYRRFIRRSGVFAKIKSLKGQIEALNALNQTIRQQEVTLREEVAAAETKEERLQALHANGNISLQEVEDAHTIYLQTKRELEGQQSLIINNDLRIKQLEVDIIDLKQNRKDGTSNRELAVLESLQSLQGLIASWEQDHLIKASIAGVVSMPRPLNAREYVQTDQALLAIVPEQEAGGIIGKALLPLQGSGKVTTGQRVNIRLEAYPFQEFGVLPGTVATKSLLPENNQILIEVKLTNGLQTTYNLSVDFTQEMQGDAYIITEDRRFLERVLDRVFSVFRNR